eukprot:CAMPEP_0179052520 /NCGR_PEP_ID=MMETSP0796-20121207/21800_1 /TAXON_ID=73915 /ORGANISM="Pyrodinium bahamense, Strain pbaha01" /LENGTH=426 /DNA_ID=CAMNT_0020749089 /DNA_START=50 /DNA_END=1327 /DNA_ORIENTATION=+
MASSNVIASGIATAVPPQQCSWAQIVKRAAATREDGLAGPSQEVAAGGSRGPSAAVAPAPQAQTEAALLALQPASIEQEEAEEVTPVHGPQPLRPAARGAQRCKCIGEVLVMLRHYGWIAPLQPIDHPDASKNRGHIYVAAQDIQDGLMLRPGDRVSFYLYVDKLGLGAEACCLTTSGAAVASSVVQEVPYHWQRPRPCSNSADVLEIAPTGAAAPRLCTFSADAPEFVPACFAGLSADAMEFVPGGKATIGSCHPGVEELIPPVGVVPRISESVPFAPIPHSGAEPLLHSVLEINAAYLTDSDTEGSEADDEAWSHDSDEEDSTSLIDGGSCRVDGQSSTCGRKGSDGEERLELSDEEETDDDAEWDDELGVVVLCVPLKVGMRGASTDGGSTAEGEGSDTEGELSGAQAPLCRVRMPPGLSLLE